MNIVAYIKETKAELSHVSWATREQAIQYTALVILISLAVSVYLGLFDSIFSFILKLII
ncbi:MAG: preprotein translocase subunit SecE [Candidatus Vogelbacteria bacterium]|nr:preprotein translocase subunit SecE [Candidatus Vogelbacteria bacterium]